MGLSERGKGLSHKQVGVVLLLCGICGGTGLLGDLLASVYFGKVGVQRCACREDYHTI